MGKMKMLLGTIAWILYIILVILPTMARRPPSPPPPRRPPSPPPPRRPPSPPPPPKDVQFTETWILASTTPTSYPALIDSLRDGVKAKEYCGIPVTAKKPASIKEFILLETISLKNKKVTLIFRAMNFYYVGFMDELKVGNKLETRANFVIEDFKELKDNNLFKDAKIKTQLPHGGNYINLQKVANLNNGRRDLKLGVNSLSPLLDKISGSDYDGKNKPKDIGQDLAKFALVAIQMIAEASRFKYIEEKVRDLGTAQGTFNPDTTFLSLQNDWDMISTLIYKTTKTDKGKIDCSIKVPVAKYSSLWPEDIKPAMGLLLYNKDERFNLNSLESRLDDNDGYLF